MSNEPWPGSPDYRAAVEARTEDQAASLRAMRRRARRILHERPPLDPARMAAHVARQAAAREILGDEAGDE